MDCQEKMVDHHKGPSSHKSHNWFLLTPCLFIKTGPHVAQDSHCYIMKNDHGFFILLPPL